MRTGENYISVWMMILCFFFLSCETDIDKEYIRPGSEVSAPVLSSEGFTNVVIDESNIDLIPLVLNWTPSDFGKEALVDYSLQVADNESFENAIVVPAGNNVYAKALRGRDLSKWAIDEFDGLDEQGSPVRVQLFMRILATLALENPTVTLPPDKIYSNAISVSVTPFNVPDSYPAEMFMIGEDFGGWDWGSDGVAEMVPVNGFEGNFWCVRYITAGNGFKWSPKRDWGSDFFSLGEDLGFYTDDGNAFVEEDGMYMVFVDMVKERISVEPAKVYGMGDCFGGWDTASYPFEVDGKTMKRTTDSAGELRLYAASDIDPVGNDWWRMEFVLIDGVIEYRGEGDDQERVLVDAGKTVILDFNTETGKIE